jgi:ATP-binding cassette subfamily C (CFTR/MRP) protein 1
LVSQSAIAIFGLLQLSFLVLWCLRSNDRTPVSIGAATLSLIDAFVFCLLSYAEHGRNIRPSGVLGAYLFFSLLFDIVHVRTLWLIGEDTNEARLFTTSVVVKVFILVLEAKSKREYLNPEDKLRGPEELSSIFSQGAFYWLNHLIVVGYRKALSLEDLYPLDEKLSALSLQAKLSKKWDQGRNLIATRFTSWALD